MTVPLVPGFVIPSGDLIDAAGFGIDATIYISGYLVPSADAPATPQIGMQRKLHRPDLKTP